MQGMGQNLNVYSSSNGVGGVWGLEKPWERMNPYCSEKLTQRSLIMFSVGRQGSLIQVNSKNPPFCDAALSTCGFQSPCVLLLLTASAQRWCTHLFLTTHWAEEVNDYSHKGVREMSGACKIFTEHFYFCHKVCAWFTVNLKVPFLERVSDVTFYRKATLCFISMIRQGERQ